MALEGGDIKYYVIVLKSSVVNSIMMGRGILSKKIHIIYGWPFTAVHCIFKVIRLVHKKIHPISVNQACQTQTTLGAAEAT